MVVSTATMWRGFGNVDDGFSWEVVEMAGMPDVVVADSVLKSDLGARQVAHRLAQAKSAWLGA